MTTCKDVLEAIASGAGPKKVLVTLGYAGGPRASSRTRSRRNGWLNVEADPRIIFDVPGRALRKGAVAARRRAGCSLRAGHA